MREPVAGRVKTRLAATLGDAAALRVYLRLAERAASAARAFPGAEVRIHFTPSDAGAAVRAWLGRPGSYHPQASGDLGRRMQHAFEEAFSAGFQRAIVVGSDLPAISVAILERAVEALERGEAVLGPASDGGYYLIGLSRPMPHLFHEMPWSTPGVLAETLARLERRGVEPVLLETLTDIDTENELPSGWRAWALDEAGGQR